MFSMYPGLFTNCETKETFPPCEKKTNKQTNSKLEIVKEDVPLQILNKAQNPIQPRSQGLFSSFGKREEPGNDQSQPNDHRMYSKGTTYDHRMTYDHRITYPL